MSRVLIALCIYTYINLIYFTKEFLRAVGNSRIKNKLVGKAPDSKYTQSHLEGEDRYKTRLNFNFKIKNKVLEYRWQTFFPS